MGGDVAVFGIKPMRLLAHVVTSELHPIASTFDCQRFGRFQEGPTNPPVALIGTNVHALDLAAPTTNVLKVLEYQHLHDTDHLIVKLGNQDFSSTAPRLLYRRPIRSGLVGPLSFRSGRSANDDVDGRRNVAKGDGTNERGHVVILADQSASALPRTLRLPAPRPSRDPRTKSLSQF
jgi:hypothetical protein